MVSELDELIASERHSGEVSVASLRRSGFVPLHA
jgi:hypothetical protein